MIKVIKTGFYSSIQDQGRFGYRAFGVPVSGAMDQYSRVFANALLGNDIKAAVLEMTMTGSELLFYKSTMITITGADMQPKLNGDAIPMFKSIEIKPNDILTFSKLKQGFRTYLAVKGGFLTELTLGSRSMVNGVTKCIRIQKNEILQISDISDMLKSKNAKLNFRSTCIEDYVLEVTKGPEFDMLSVFQKELLFSQKHQVSKFNNRMAYQLLPLFENTLSSILTGPVLPGTVQLTPAGQLIVLMRDAQTTGGYPRVLQLTDMAINLLSQKTVGNDIRFNLVAF